MWCLCLYVAWFMRNIQANTKLVEKLKGWIPDGLCEAAYQVDVCNRAQVDFNASMSYGIEKNVYDQTLKCLLD